MRKYVHPPVLLVGSSRPKEGDVVLTLADGSVGAVCDSALDAVAADVLCRQAGFLGVETATNASRYGSHNYSIVVNELTCTGNETRIQDCVVHTNGSCPSQGRAGVVCTEGVSDESEMD